MSSRDGLRFDRSFKEAFVRPGLDQRNWHERGIYMDVGLLHTSPTEMSGKSSVRTIVVPCTVRPARMASMICTNTS